VCEIVAGGAERFSERPFLLAYFEPISPLLHPEDMLDILFVAAERCIPIVYTTMSIGGATAPITLSGNLAICNAEMLSSITIAQLVREGLPCVYGGIPGPMDMRSTRFAYGSPESMLLCAAFTDLAHYYNLPMFGTAGVTDAVDVDCQAATEIALNCFLAIMSGANLVHDVAQFAGGDSSSMEGMVLTDEIIAMLRHIMQPIDTSPESLALDLIDAVGPCGNFLAEKHTVKHHRAIWHPTIFNRVGIDKWFENPRRVSENLKQKVEEILEKHQPAALDDQVLAQLEQIEGSWWREGDIS
jgi:trimethylamine--corrinoid protein Co-methyltransferase